MQRSGGLLPEAQARSLLVGIGTAVPPPTMAGLPVPRPTVTQQTWQSAPQIPGARPAAAPAAAAASTAFPPMPAADAQRYRDVFARMDTDRNGYVEVSSSYQSTMLLCCFSFSRNAFTGKCIGKSKEEQSLFRGAFV